jgi:hypothetical protein
MGDEGLEQQDLQQGQVSKEHSQEGQSSSHNHANPSPGVSLQGEQGAPGLGNQGAACGIVKGVVENSCCIGDHVCSAIPDWTNHKEAVISCGVHSIPIAGVHSWHILTAEASLLSIDDPHQEGNQTATKSQHGQQGHIESQGEGHRPQLTDQQKRKDQGQEGEDNCCHGKHLTGHNVPSAFQVASSNRCNDINVIVLTDELSQRMVGYSQTVLPQANIHSLEDSRVLP